MKPRAENKAAPDFILYPLGPGFRRDDRCFWWKGLRSLVPSPTFPLMLNLISLGIGAVALILTLVAFLPFVGWANWFILPLAVTGLAIGAVSRGKAGQNLNLVVVVIGVVRLMLGGGLF